MSWGGKRECGSDDTATRHGRFGTSGVSLLKFYFFLFPRFLFFQIFNFRGFCVILAWSSRFGIYSFLFLLFPPIDPPSDPPFSQIALVRMSGVGLETPGAVALSD